MIYTIDTFISVHDISSFISVADVDGDDVRCRWAEQSRGECGGVCRAINATLCGVKLYL